MGWAATGSGRAKPNGSSFIEVAPNILANNV
jgi:hypothetical protein